MATPDVELPLATTAAWEQRAELRNRSTSPSRRGGRLQQDIHVFVAKQGSGRLEDVLSQEALNKVKIRLKLRGWSISNSSLVLGERDLLQQEVLDELADSAASRPPFLHIAVRLADVQSACFSNSAGQQITFDLGGSSPKESRPRRSALTSALAQGADAPAGTTSNSLVVRGQFLRAGEELEGALDQSDSSSDGGAVVHLVVRRTAKLSWNVCGSSFELSISASDPADLVKRRAEAATGLPHGSHLLLHNGQVLAGRSLCEYGIRKGSVLELVPYYEPSVPQSMPEGSPLLSSPDHELFDGFQAAREGLRNGHAPRLAASGTGGSYFISNAAGQPVAVFKPLDEEPLAANNPKQHKGLSSSPSDHGLRRGIRPGEGAMREVAAYLLDHEHFAGVPPTALVSCHDSGPLPPEYSKVGSLQAYVEAEGDCEEWGVSQFPTHEVHKIALLDMRLGNCDRNGGNILVRTAADGARQLVPIDHGNTLPDTFTDISFEWTYWPQARAPLDAACRAYVARMDADRDLGILAQHGLALRPECARVLRVLTALLKKGAARGLTPFDIASIMCREGFGKSPLEKLHARAMRRTVSHGPGPARAHAASVRGASLSAAAEPVYLRHMHELIDEYLDETVLTSLAPGA